MAEILIKLVKLYERISELVKTRKEEVMLYAKISLLVLFVAIVFFDKILAVGVLFLLFLNTAFFLFLSKIGVKDKKLYVLSSIAFLVHLAAVLFIYYANFRPFGGGADFEMYHSTAVEISHRFRRGNFSLEGLYSNHYFPVLIGVIYIFTLPEMLIGQFFAVWLSVLSVLLVYFLVLEIGGSKKSAFWAGIIAAFYPSYLYFGSVLLKDIVVLPLVLSGLLLAVKMMKNFRAIQFFGFFIVLTGLIHLRFYIGLALMFSFVVCWFLISNLVVEKRIIYGLIIITLLGFSPQLLDYGYYGIKPLMGYLNKHTITTYREVVYAPAPPKEVAYVSAPGPTFVPNVSETPCISNPEAVTENKSPDQRPEQNQPSKKGASSKKNIPACNGPNTNSAERKLNETSGVRSSFVIKAGFENPFTFVINYFQSFIYSLLGPFPWQIKEKKQILSLFELIPWYFLFGTILYNAYQYFKSGGFPNFFKHYRYAFPLIMFSLMALGALSLYINNFGIIIRIRIPALIVLSCVAFLYVENFKVKNLFNSFNLK